MQFKLLVVSVLSTLAIAAPAVEERTINGYAVRNFARNCTNSHVCTYDFNIDTGNEKIACTIKDETPIITKRTGTLATTHQFYDIPCQQDYRWHISWGWDYPNDFTVMTVMHAPNKKRAFFGYSHPNVGLPVVSYPDVGPNAVQDS